MTRIVDPTIENLDHAACLLRGGDIVAFPTETVYGLGADATSDAAVKRIYSAKGRPSFNPLIVHTHSIQAARHVAIFSNIAASIAERFWPGPLTLILPLRRDCGISGVATAGLSTIGVRVPANDVALELLKRSNIPIAAPSANVSGHVSSTQAMHVEHDFEDRVSIILNGGPTRHGVESTILDMTVGDFPAILREGAITQSKLEPVLMSGFERPVQTAIKAPGQLTVHYSPKKPIRLNATSCDLSEAFLSFGSVPAPNCQKVLNLSRHGDLEEAAHNLFSMLRKLDRSDASAIAVASIPNRGVGVAINDRLNRAAARKRFE